MRRWLWTGLVALPIIIVWFYIFVKNTQEVLISPVESAPTPMPTEVPHITPTATLSAVLGTTTIASVAAKPKKITPTAKSTPTPTMATSEEVYKLIEKYAPMKGIDPNVIRHMALCESGFRSNATNGIYAGLFQFAPASWRSIRAEMSKDTNIDLRYSPEEAIQTAIYALSMGRGGMWPNCMP